MDERAAARLELIEQLALKWRLVRHRRRLVADWWLRHPAQLSRRGKVKPHRF